MAVINKENALRYHEEGRPGKITVVPTKPHKTAEDLSLAYSPGVAYPCLEIQNDPDTAYKYTDKGNLVAVISNGTAVLGLGDIGALSGKPVMEGKGLLFKIYGGIDVFDIEVNEKDPVKFCEAVERIAPTFGGINLEDIKAPECFYIEDRLKKTLDIPVMHDDQHGTAIISSAGLLNALEVVGKKIEDIRIVVSGAGAAAISCTRLYVQLGARKENILMLDSKGVITSDRENLDATKKEFATDRRDVHTLEEAIAGADMFLGLSKGNVLTQDMVRSMASSPIVFALANPTPEISYEDAKASRPDVLIATGRSDYPNQINNVIGFPYIFRGALDVHAKAINSEMKLAAVHAIADLAKKPVPENVSRIYKVDKLSFGPDYLIPKPIDPRLITDVSEAVAKAAIESGVARKIKTDWDKYRRRLLRIMGYQSRGIQNLRASARLNPQKVVFADCTYPNVLKAVASSTSFCTPILLGSKEAIAKLADELKVDIEGISVIDPQEDPKFAGCNYSYGLQMVQRGEADAVILGSNEKLAKSFEMARDIVGTYPGFDHFATMSVILSNDSFYFMADTLVNRNPDKWTLKEIARLLDRAVKALGIEPVIATVSYSNFDEENGGSPQKMREVAKELQKEGLLIEGEMSIDIALDTERRDRRYPGLSIQGKDVNCLIFNSLTASNSAFKMIRAFSRDVEVLGPVQLGLNKSVQFIDLEADYNDIANNVAIACLGAILRNSSGY